MGDQISGLARILSNQPKPMTPMFRTTDVIQLASEMEAFTRNLYHFLDELFGAFTAENIITTINNGGGGAFSPLVNKTFYFKSSGETTEYVLNNAVDWRKYFLVWNLAIATDLDDLTIFGFGGTNFSSNGGVFPESLSQQSADISIGGTGLGGNYTPELRIKTDGSLILYNNSGGADEAYLRVFVGAMGKIDDNVANLILVGNNH